ncbi:MAG: hypothetical protein HeimC3_17310 [Candidatus Heimdallarchaeota archaeon LC_3]|nr:MAG: hypothetical protein HeimC3_17310 [Candidatus Heimdallarchaeota archaeon LC_3]
MIIKSILPNKVNNSIKGHFYYRATHFYDIQVQIKPDNYGWNFIWSLQPLSKPFIVDTYEELVSPHKEPAEYYIVFDEDINKQIGWMCIGKVDWNNTSKIYDLFISPDYQRRGIGSLLVEKAEIRSRNWNKRALTLEVQSCNHQAIIFYRKNGFEFTGFDLTRYSNDYKDQQEIGLTFTKILK